MKLLILFLFATGAYISSRYTELKVQAISTEKQEAVIVLDRKCNVCHSIENPSRVFTFRNMNDLARNINRQVFVWKRMPKGSKNWLTTTEKEKLKRWLNSQLNK